MTTNLHLIFPFHQILPVKKYGGTERILFWLMKELVKLGARVTFIGPPSQPQDNLSPFGIHFIPFKNKQMFTDPLWWQVIPDNADLIHFSFPIQETILKNIHIPFVITLHGNGQVHEKFHPNTLFLSKDHAQRHQGEAFVYNGIDLDEYPKKKNLLYHQSSLIKSLKNNFLFLAKASWRVKNLKDCIQACKKKKKHLFIAGGRAFTFNPFIHSFGQVGHLQKIALLEQSSALLFPVRWPEPFGLAMIEALAMGVPIIGSCYGSLPEIIKPEVGMMASNFNEFCDYIGLENLEKRFPKESLREYVEKNFTATNMAMNYLNFYNMAIKKIPFHSQGLQTIAKQSPLTLLPF